MTPLIVLGIVIVLAGVALALSASRTSRRVNDDVEDYDRARRALGRASKR